MVPKVDVIRFKQKGKAKKQNPVQVNIVLRQAAATNSNHTNFSQRKEGNGK